ncbi:MAG: type II toxin-antitoxin system VapC family toxin [Actinomycetota bacterium]
MFLLDINVLVYAHKSGMERHREYLDWVKSTVSDQAPFGLSELALSGFVRVVTHPRIFDQPSSLDDAFGFIASLRDRPNAVMMRPGPRHWDIFEMCCRSGRANGSHVVDAYHAALAMETGSTWITTDRGFARFPGLDWRHPLGR